MNPNIKLKLIKPKKVAVLTFNGNYSNEAAVKEKAAEFKAILEEHADELRVKPQWTFAGYNAPFTIPYFRRNEIHFEVEN